MASWSLPKRVAALVSHCGALSALWFEPQLHNDKEINLYVLRIGDDVYRLSVDEPNWRVREGPLCFSLWHGIDRMFSISYCIGSVDGRRIVYVGGIQGRYGPDVLARYKIFTRHVHGMRPRDFLLETFKVHCRSIGATEIRAVTKENHYLNKRFDEIEFALHYNDIWMERGGVDSAMGYYVLPVRYARRNDKEIRSKKRKMYATRYALLDLIEQEFFWQAGEGPFSSPPVDLMQRLP